MTRPPPHLTHAHNTHTHTHTHTHTPHASKTSKSPTHAWRRRRRRWPGDALSECGQELSLVLPPRPPSAAAAAAAAAAVGDTTTPPPPPPPCPRPRLPGSPPSRRRPPPPRRRLAWPASCSTRPSTTGPPRLRCRPSWRSCGPRGAARARYVSSHGDAERPLERFACSPMVFLRFPHARTGGARAQRPRRAGPRADHQPSQKQVMWPCTHDVRTRGGR